jgi:hypothetical protein
MLPDNFQMYLNKHLSSDISLAKSTNYVSWDGLLSYHTSEVSIDKDTITFILFMDIYMCLSRISIPGNVENIQHMVGSNRFVKILRMFSYFIQINMFDRNANNQCE